MDDEITVTHGFLWWKRERTYFGSSTVWHDAKTGKRASSGLEAHLSEIWSLRRYRAAKAKAQTNEKPTAA